MVWPAADFAAIVSAFRQTGFRPANSWYLNDDINMDYATAAPNNGYLQQPVLFVNGTLDTISNIDLSRAGDPMRAACKHLSVANLVSGHWVPLECKSELVQAIRSWLSTL